MIFIDESPALDRALRQIGCFGPPEDVLFVGTEDGAVPIPALKSFQATIDFCGRQLFDHTLTRAIRLKYYTISQILIKNREEFYASKLPRP